MAQLPITVSGGTPPYFIFISEAQAGTAVTCNVNCQLNANGTYMVTYNGLPGVHTYKVQVTDSSNPSCIQEQLTGNVTCAEPIAAPSFTINTVQPQCVNNVLTQASLSVNNLANADRYKIVAGTNLPGTCDGTTPTNGAGSFTVQMAAPTAGTSTVYTIRIWNAAGCGTYTDRQFTLTSPSCTPAQTCTLSISLGTATC